MCLFRGLFLFKVPPSLSSHPSNPAPQRRRVRRGVQKRVLCLRASVAGRPTYIFTGEGGKQLELFKGVPLGRHKVEEHLQLTAAEETPLQELAARRADAQLADWLSLLLGGLRRQGLLQGQTDRLGGGAERDRRG